MLDQIILLNYRSVNLTFGSLEVRVEIKGVYLSDIGLLWPETSCSHRTPGHTVLRSDRGRHTAQLNTNTVSAARSLTESHRVPPGP